jgi:radical SAM enzyme (TIGR01210 family)
VSAPTARRRDAAIRALRPPKAAVDPWRPLAVRLESERRRDALPRRVAVVFLAGRECPFTCVFCDLWRSTLDGDTPVGSLPAQIDAALADLGAVAAECDGIKLYNASNFFDPRAVPDADLAEIVARTAPFERVTVESHPRLAGIRALDLARRLAGELEVAMGLETVHPRVLPRLNKAMTLDDFERAATTLLGAGIAVRAFVLLGVPFLAPAEQVEWTVRSAERAVALGAGHVAIIPVRGGNGEMERLAAAGAWAAPSLSQLEAALEGSLDLPAVVTADTWDLERLADCASCFERRRARLEAMNLGGTTVARRPCPGCGWS